MAETFRECRELAHIIWFDSSTENSRAREGELKRLRQSFDDVTDVQDEQSAVRSVESIPDDKIIIITSGRCAKLLLDRIIHLTQIDCVFIYCLKTESYRRLIDQYPKIIGIFANLNKMIQVIHDRILYIDSHADSFAILDIFHDSMHDLTLESAEFLSFLIAKDIILRLPQRSNAKEELIRFCRQYYLNCSVEQSRINDFEKNYDPKEILYWYTKESFVYKMINKALRSQDIDLIERFSFLIRDLIRRLSEECSHMMETPEFPLTTYRGVQLQKSEVDRISRSIDHVICSPGFWSTSRNRARALLFATKYPTRNDTVNVILEIIYPSDLTGTNIICADISKHSDHREEKEVLFGLGCCFKIISVKEEQNTCVIQLQCVDGVKSISKGYFHDKMKELLQMPPQLALTVLMIDMGRYLKAQRYLEAIVTDASEQDRRWIELNLGRAKYYQGHLTEARYRYDRAYTLMMNTTPPRLQDAAAVLHNIAVLLQCQGNYKEALQKYEEALKIRRKYLSDDDIEIQRSLMNIGACLHRLGLYQEALASYNDALTMHAKCRPEDHPERAMCLNNIGNTYAEQGRYTLALSLHQEALKIRRTILPSRHPDIAISLQNIGNVYREQGQYAQALESLQQALDIRKIAFIRHHPLIADTLFNLALVYQSQNKHDQAMDYHEQALHIRENHYHDGHRDIAESLISMSTILIEEKKYEDACKLCDRAKSDLTRLGLCDDRLYGSCLHNLGVIWFKKRSLNKAMDYLLEALRVHQQSLPEYHLDTAETYQQLSIVSEQLKKFQDARQYYNKSLQIKEALASSDSAEN